MFKLDELKAMTPPPKNWRTILLDIFNRPLPGMVGEMDSYGEYLSSSDQEKLTQDREKIRELDSIQFEIARLQDLKNPAEDRVQKSSRGQVRMPEPLTKLEYEKKIYELLAKEIKLKEELDSKEYQEYIKNYVFPFSSLDHSFLLATKIALESNSAIADHTGKIQLALSGGFMNRIIFSEYWSKNISDDQPCAIVRKRAHKFDPTNRSKEHDELTLKQFPYNEVSLFTPRGYYFVTDTFVIEISYQTAPILFDSSHTARIGVSLVNKRIDEAEQQRLSEIEEEEEKERRREEERRIWDEDW